jgi:hypothetical protein
MTPATYVMDHAGEFLGPDRRQRGVGIAQREKSVPRAIEEAAAVRSEERRGALARLRADQMPSNLEGLRIEHDDRAAGVLDDYDLAVRRVSDVRRMLERASDRDAPAVRGVTHDHITRQGC